MNRIADVTLVFDTDGTLLDGRQAVIDAVAEGLSTTYRHFQLPLVAADHERIALAMGLPAPMFFRTAFAPDTVPAPLHDAFACEFEVRSTRAEISQSSAASAARGPAQTTAFPLIDSPSCPIGESTPAVPDEVTAAHRAGKSASEDR